MFSFKAQRMPLMYAQRVVNKYLTRCAKKKGAKDIQINEQQTKNRAPTSYKHTQIYPHDIILYTKLLCMSVL